jgi:serine/threonine-protein kinase
MGVVLRAHDPVFQRTLAVKLLRAQYRGKADLCQRFLEEAQVLGQLQHPGIPPVHDLGELPDGRPFFTMKLIKGRTLAELLAERLSPAHELPRFITIFGQLCQTLAYAHSRGILHRDLKPANLMVGAFGEVQVMDWGLAKVLARAEEPGAGVASTEYSVLSTQYSVLGTRDPGAPIGPAPSRERTQVGAILGTPAYMAPEQARGEVDRLDERTDVFGLGAILCVILTGQPPYADADREEGQRRPLLELLADAHARLDRCGLDGELVTLAKICLAADPTQRPRHAGAVAEAVARYQAQVQERLRQADRERAQAQVKVVEERKRRRLTLALTAALLLLVLGGSGAALWYQRQEAAWAADEAARETKEAARAQEQELRLTHARAGVQLALKEAITLGERALTLINNPSSWQATLAAALTAVKQAQTLLAGEPGLAREPLAQQVEQVKAKLEADEKDRQLLADFDRVREKQSRLEDSGRFVRKPPSYLELKEILKKYGLSPGEGSIKEAVSYLRGRPQVIQNQVIAVLQECLTWTPRTKVKEGEWVKAVLAEADADPWRQQVRQALVGEDREKLEELLAKVEVGRQHPAFLVGLVRTLHVKTDLNVVPLLRQVQQQYPADFWVNVELATDLMRSMRSAGSVRSAEEKERPLVDETLRYITAALAVRPDSVWMRYKVGNLLRIRGDLDGALVAHRKTLALYPRFAEAHVDMGAILQARGDWEGAFDAYQKAIKFDPQNAAAYSSLGNLLMDRDDFKGAITACRKAIDLDPQFASAHLNLGIALYETGDLDGAIASWEQTIKLDPNYTKAHHNLGVALDARGKLTAATASFKKAIALAPKQPDTHISLGGTLLKMGRFADAKSSLEQALKLMPPGQVPIPGLPDRKAVLQLLKQCEQLLELDARLTAVLKGAEPESAEEQLELAALCMRYKKRYATAARFFGAALPDLIPPVELRSLIYFEAACAAVLAAAGKGEDAAKLDSQEQKRLRQQALVWLREALTNHEEGVKSGAANRRTAAQRELRSWQKNLALASVRDKEALAELPEVERAGWQQFWTDIEALLKKSENPCP